MSLRDDLFDTFPALRKLRAPGAAQPVYVVGGAVRDLIRGIPPADVDVAAADPLPLAKLLGGRIIRLGKEKLTAIRVVRAGAVYDFTEIEGGDVAGDLRRRDFTINAIAVDLATGTVLDPHGGREDLALHVVRMIAASNFDDDPLRLLKALRMAIVLGFTIDPATMEAIRARASAITAVAPERVTYELTRILGAGQLRDAIALLRDSGLAAALALRTPEVHADAVPLQAALALLVDDPAAYAAHWRWSDALAHDVAALQSLVSRHDRVALFDAGSRVARLLPTLLRALGREETLDWPDFDLVPLLDGDAIARAAHEIPGPRLGALKRALVEAQLWGRVTSQAEAVEFIMRESRK